MEIRLFKVSPLAMVVAAVGAMVLALVLASPAWAATITVNDDATGPGPAGADCATPDHTTIQDAVDAAASGDTILVCAGTYTEQVSIDKDLTLTGAGAEQTTIKAPDDIVPNSEAEGVLVDIFNGADVTMSQVKLAGPKPPPLTCDFAEALDLGIWVRGGANLDLDNASVVDIRDEPLSGCQTGIGVFVGGSFVPTTGTATIDNVTFSGYQKGGIVVSNAGSSATITDNTITGAGNTPAIAQNGIQVDSGATATVKRNDISQNLCDNSTCGPAIEESQSTGIILFEAGDTIVRDNDINENDAGIIAGVQDGSIATISKNRLLDNRYEGIFAFDGAVEVNNNSISGDSNVGVQAVSFDGGSDPDSVPTVNIRENTITGADRGIEATRGDPGTTSPTVTASFNRLDGNTTAGVRNDGAGGTISAENNWWGCNEGPNEDGCSAALGDVDFDPWLVLTITADDTTLNVGQQTTLTADMTINSDDEDTSSDGVIPDGEQVTFASGRGPVNPTTATITDGTATSTLTANNRGMGAARATVDNATAEVSITVGVPPTISIADTSVIEGNSGTNGAKFTVTRRGNTSGTSTVQFATSDASATNADNDYEPRSFTITFAPGRTTRELTVKVNGDTKDEPNENFKANLSAPTNATITDRKANGTIINDDG